MSYVNEYQSRGAGAIAAEDLGAIARTSGLTTFSKTQIATALKAPTAAQTLTSSSPMIRTAVRFSKPPVRRDHRQGAAPTSKPPFPNAVWVPPTGTGVRFQRGYWKRKAAAAPKRRAKSVRHTTPRLDECVAAGVPAELINACTEGLMAGVSIEEVVATLQAESAPPEAIDAVVAEVIDAVATRKSRKSRVLLYGGVAVAGLALFLLLRKKKS